MLDRFEREINYLRISVTDRCNLRCTYCISDENAAVLLRDDLLSFDEIAQITRTAVEMGINKVRLTGGEPLVRDGIVELVSILAEIDGINDFAMSTNGILLSKFAKPLAEAGLQRVNISLDAVESERYRELTGGGELNKVLAGIDAAKYAGLDPIKLNCVVNESSSEPDARAVADFAAINDIEVRFIRRMDLRTGEFWIVEGGSGGDCKNCNRIRLTSNGFIRPCLFSDLNFNVRKLGAEKAIKMALSKKPRNGIYCRNCDFHAIGG